MLLRFLQLYQILSGIVILNLKLLDMCRLTIRVKHYGGMDRLTIILEKLNFLQLFTCAKSMYIDAIIYIYTLFSYRPYTCYVCISDARI